jgi:hypothetical protein
MLEHTPIVRDCYWLMPSGDVYLHDENGDISSKAHSLKRSFNTNDSEYIQSSNSGEIHYYGRLRSNNLNTTAIYANIRAECDPPGSAVFSINDQFIGAINIDSKNNYSENFELNNVQQERIHRGRILDNYDYFDVQLESADAVYPEMPTPNMWFDASENIYEHLYDANRRASGDPYDTGPVRFWQSKAGTRNAFINTGTATAPKYAASLINGQPAVGVTDGYLKHEVDYKSQAPLRQEQGSFYIVIQRNTLDTSETLFESHIWDGTAAPKGRIGTDAQRLEYGWTPRPTYQYLPLPEQSFFSVDTIPQDEPIALGIFTQNSLTYEMEFNGSGTDSTYSGYAKWFDGLQLYIENGYAGVHSYIGKSFDGYIAEIIAYERYIDQNERAGVERYIRDKYNLDVTYVNPDMKMYNVDIYASGDTTWDNHETGLPTVITETFYPTSFYYTGAAWSGDVSNINNVGSMDNEWIEKVEDEIYSSDWLGSDLMPSGYLSLSFSDHIASGVDPRTEITRAVLNLRYALPPSGDYENIPDTFEVNVFNPYYKDRGHAVDLDYLTFSALPNNQKGYFLYGAGDVIESNSLSTNSIELNFLDPGLPSGNFSSINYRNIDVLSKAEFRITGIPSGTQLTYADLQVEYTPNNILGMYVAGDVKRCQESSTVDVGTDNSYLLGDGGWHHLGWRYGVPFEQEIFDNFYRFSDVIYSTDGPTELGYRTVDPSYTRTFPESVYYPGYAGNKYEAVHGIYVTRAPNAYDTTLDTEQEPVGNELEVAPERVYEYYKSPLILEGINDYGELYDYPDPTRYRYMIYQGDALASFDSQTPSEGELSDEIRQIYFPDLPLDVDFTLYFMVYRTYFERSFGMIFERGGLMVPDALGTNLVRDGSFEIQVHSQPGYIEAYMRSASGYNYSLQVDIDKNSTEPILIWVSSHYEDGYTTFYLGVHDDINNYFGQTWKSANKTFAGYRYQQENAKTTLGTLDNDTYMQHLSGNKYLNHVSFCEFGYANRYIEFDPLTTTSSLAINYDDTYDSFKSFIASRICNSQYLLPNSSGVQWRVPDGIGERALWSTDYSIDSWAFDSETTHSLSNPVGLGGTNEWIHPSAIMVDLNTTHNTNHPSGVNVYIDLEFDSGSVENWKVGHIEFNLPSGETTTTRGALSKYFNMEGGPIRYSDLSNINLRVTTEYLDISDQIDETNGNPKKYYGELTINTVNVIFDSYCVAATGVGDLDLYISGDATTNNNNLDLYIQSYIEVNDNLDLYIHGESVAVSGDITLYTKAERGTLPSPNDPNATYMSLFVEGLDPPVSSGDFDMYIWGTEYPATIKKMPLFINSAYDPGNTLNLFVNAGTGSINENLNLFVGKIAEGTNNEMPLYMLGPSGINESAHLYVRGLGTTDGAYPLNSDMNLFIARDSEATAQTLPLYLRQHGVTNNISMYLQGAEIPGSSIPMYIKGSGIPNETITLYSHGF